MGLSVLEEKLGLDRCLEYSPLMSYLLTGFGASEPDGQGAQLLGEALGFPVSATAVQRNTEAVGEVDETINAQIEEHEGMRGRESLKAPTEWKECNVAVIEKHFQGTRSMERGTGGRYGKFFESDSYVGRAVIAMGQHHAECIAFIADGAPQKWELQRMYFPTAVPIQDFYHISEHLAAFCELVREAAGARRRYRRWRALVLGGQSIQIRS
jgi:hypothetical protein